MRTKRIAIGILVAAGCAGIAAGSYCLGVRNAPQKTVTRTVVRAEDGSEIQEETVTESRKGDRTDRIAVVDLDLGADTDDGRIYYGERLTEESGSRFETTSLENARSGINDGTYAAYIVIPADFSACVVSLLDQTPQQASLRYEFNPNLAASYQSQAMYDVLEFHQMLNDGVEYMYVDSILQTFHGAQDTAVKIMENDEQDNAAIAALKAEDLTTLLTIAPAESAVLDRETLDISSYTAAQTAAVEALRRGFDDAAEQIRLQADALSGRSADLEAGAAEITDAFSDIHFSAQTSANLTSVLLQEGTAYDEKLGQYEENLRHLLEEIQGNNLPAREALDVIRTYNDSLPEKRQTLAERILEEAGSGEEETSLTQEQLEALIDEQFVPLASEYSTQQSAGSDTAETVSLDALADALSKEEADLDAFLAQGADGQEAPLSIARYDWEALTGTLDAVYSDDAKEAEQQMRQAVQSGTQRIRDFAGDVADFRPESALDSAGATTQESAIQQNSAQLAALVTQRDRQADENLAEINSTSQRNTEQLRAALTELNEDSNERVEAGLETVKNRKAATTEENRQALTALTEQLPYTRLGSLPYTEAYRFIVTPTTISRSLGQDTSGTDTTGQTALSGKPAESVSETGRFPLAGLLYLLLAVAAAVTVLYAVRSRTGSER